VAGFRAILNLVGRLSGGAAQACAVNNGKEQGCSSRPLVCAFSQMFHSRSISRVGSSGVLAEERWQQHSCQQLGVVCVHLLQHIVVPLPACWMCSRWKGGNNNVASAIASGSAGVIGTTAVLRFAGLCAGAVVGGLQWGASADKEQQADTCGWPWHLVFAGELATSIVVDITSQWHILELYCCFATSLQCVTSFQCAQM